MNDQIFPIKKPVLVAISGGIGAGKSVVSEILRVLGYKVFDCDSEAKRIMDQNDDIKHEIQKQISINAINADGSINRRLLSEIVFKDEEMLKKLNRIVHSYVRNEIIHWANINCKANILFIETAILYQSGIDKMVDLVIEVAAPVDIRIDRVKRRSNLSEKEILRRVMSQDHTPESPHSHITVITNDGTTAVLPQLYAIINDQSMKHV